MEKLTLVFPIALIAFLLLFFSEYLPLKTKTVPAAPAGRRVMTEKDRLLCGGLTLLYAFFAFLGLGNTTGPVNYCKFEDRGYYAVIELPNETDLGMIRYFPGLYTGSYYVAFSSDGENWSESSVLNQGYNDLFKWRDATPSEGEVWQGRYVRLIADSRLWLGEIAFYDNTGKKLDASEMTYKSGCAPLLDEQETVPEEANYLNSAYFDEIYHPRTALEHICNISPYEISHPPLGKLILSVGIRLFGMVPFGWRCMGAFFGVMMLPALYYLLKKLFEDTPTAACGTALFAFDFMHFVQTRIATIDTYGVFFMLLMYLFFYRYLTAERGDGKPRRAWLLPLALSGISFGLGAASKWTDLYAGAGLGVLWLLDRIMRFLRTEDRKAALREARENVLWCLLFFVAIPALIYYLSYTPYGTAKGMHGIGMYFSGEYFRTVLNNQTSMFTYHSGVTATHPYSSRWWQWLLDIRPILYYQDSFPDGTKTAFGAFVNPVLCWGGLLAMLCMAYRSVRYRDNRALFILIGFLAQLLPWVFISRITFFYHYFPCTVFLVLALGYVFSAIRRSHPNGLRLLLVFTGISLLLFAAYYPVLRGLRVSTEYTHNFLRWFSTWPF